MTFTKHQLAAQRLDAPVLDAQGVARLDARLKVAGLLDVSMEHAGHAVASQAARLWPDVSAPVLVLVGSGANGGDALVAARHLLALGYAPTVLALGAKHPLTQLNRRRLSAVGIRPSALNTKSLRGALRAAPGVIDGLLGTGFAPPMRPHLAELIELLNVSARPTLSIDLPSGLSANSAEALPCVQAHHTAALGSLKPALLYGPANHAAGHVSLASLNLPPTWLAAEAVAQRPSDQTLSALLPKRFADAHKGAAGKVWIIGGEAGTLGAPLLAGRAALRAGAGLVSVYSPAELPLSTPELMLHRLTTTPDSSADPVPDLSQLAQQPKPSALAVGMGLGPAAAQVARTVLGWQLPTVVDADALQPELIGAGHDQTIWTPHPGEAARLLSSDVASITRNPLAAARLLQSKLGGVVVLKGGPSTIASEQGLFVSRGGHPGMATAGMGDTLSGILAALLAQGLSAEQAALVGVRLHAKAGELAGAQQGYGLIASDVAEHLGAAWALLRSTESMTAELTTTQ